MKKNLQISNYKMGYYTHKIFVQIRLSKYNEEKVCKSEMKYFTVSFSNTCICFYIEFASNEMQAINIEINKEK